MSASIHGSCAHSSIAACRGAIARVLSALHDLPMDAPETQANFAWLRAVHMSGSELAGHLQQSGVLVAPGGPLGDEDHVRAAIRGPAATERLLSALRGAFREG